MDTSVFLEQLNVVLAEYDSIKQRAQYDDLSDVPEHSLQTLTTRAVATVHRISGKDSTYSREIQRLLGLSPYLSQHVNPVLGVTRALKEDVQANYVLSVVELAHGEVFGDFLEMAQHLHENGFKDAAAVIAGSSLEAHLRALCAKFKIQTDEHRNDGSVISKKADRLNSDLASADVYSKLDQKSVTAWLDLRNKAAHGKFTEYTAEQVALLISSVRDFVTRKPA